MTENKRIACRKQLRCRALVLLGEGRTVNAVAKDISSGGLALVTREPLVGGQSCVVAFVLPSNGGPRPVSAKVAVRHGGDKHDRGYHAGLQFLDIDRESAWMIWDFVSYSPQQAPFLLAPVDTSTNAFRALFCP